MSPIALIAATPAPGNPQNDAELNPAPDLLHHRSYQIDKAARKARTRK
jgi:hypothetical protein